MFMLNFKNLMMKQKHEIKRHTDWKKKFKNLILRQDYLCIKIPQALLKRYYSK